MGGGPVWLPSAQADEGQGGAALRGLFDKQLQAYPNQSVESLQH